MTPPWWTRASSRWARRFRSSEDEAARELAAHVELEIEELQERGTPLEEARGIARRTMGNVTAIKEQIHEQSPWAWWEQLRQDVRHARRSFARTPAFAVAVVLTLALSVGANGAIFSVADALMLRPLPVRDPQSLVVLDDTALENFTYPDYVTLRDRNETLDDLIAASNAQRFGVTADGEAEVASVQIVTDNFFSSLGVQPSVGRLIAPGDDRTPIAVLSSAYWHRRFGSAPGIAGRTLRIGGITFTIAGVAAERFSGTTPGEAPDVWATIALMPAPALAERGFSWLYPIGRLKPGISLDAARANLSGLLERGEVPTRARVELSPGAHGAARWRSRIASPVLVLAALVGLVLLIACTNLAALMLTRGIARRRELAIRLALGASRGRLVRQLMTEAFLLASAGGAASLVVAAWGSRLLVRMASGINPSTPLSLDTAVNGRLLLFTIALTTMAGVLFALAPAVRTVHIGRDVASASGERIIDAHRRWGLRGVLTLVQVTLSLVLVAASFIFARTLRNLETQDLGFRPDGLLRVELMGERGYRPPADFSSKIAARLRALPGVESVSAAAFGTLSNSGGVNGLVFDGFTPRDDQDGRARADWVGADYFRTAGVRLVAGRSISTEDHADAAKVAVLNQTAARYYFGSDAAAIDRTFVFNKNVYAIVGVAADAKYVDLREPPRRMIYFALAQRAAPAATFEVRTRAGAATPTLAAIRAAVREVDPRLTVLTAQTAGDLIAQKLGRERMLAGISTVFGAVTLLLVAIGVYGTVAFAASQRTREIGMRLALGATRSGVAWLVVRDLAWVVVAGAVLGIAAAFWLGRLVASQLYDVTPADPITLAGAAGTLLVAALAAALLPARRASRLDPAAILRD